MIYCTVYIGILTLYNTVVYSTADIENDNFLHTHGLRQKYFTQKSALITKNLICDKTA